MSNRRVGFLLGAVVLGGVAIAAPAPAGSRRAANGHTDYVLPTAEATPPAVPEGAGPPDSEVPADGETDPVQSAGDAADDMAFWVHPTDPAKSVVIGTDRAGGLEVYEMSGKRIQRIDLTIRPSNVDVRSGFSLAGALVDVVAVTGDGMHFYTIDPNTRMLTNVTSPGVKPDIPVAGNCLYRSPVSGKIFIFADTRAGQAEQWELFDDGGRIGIKTVRGPWQVGSEAEGCVFDDANQALYVAEETVGIWRYGAEPDSPTTDRILVDGVGGGHMAADIEGLAVVSRGEGGYLLASSQGDDSFVVYRRNEPWEFVKKFTVPAGEVADGCSGTDGIDAVAASLGPLYPDGAFACQDHVNDAPGTEGNQNFKLVRLERVLDLR